MIKPFPFQDSTWRVSAVFVVVVVIIITIIIIIITILVVILAHSYWCTNCELMALGEDNSNSNYNCCHQTNQSCVTCCLLHFSRLTLRNEKNGAKRSQTRRDETKRRELRRNGASTANSTQLLCVVALPPPELYGSTLNNSTKQQLLMNATIT